MAKVKSEYEVESSFIEQLTEMGYDYIEIKNYDEIKANFREQFCKLNKDALIEKKGVAELSDSEFDKIMLRLDNHSIYESAKILREKWVLDLDNGETVYVQFLTNNPEQNIYQVTHQVTMDKDHLNEVTYKNRYDVTVLINGLPLIQIELKRPGVEINEAINQINRYRKFSFKGLFRYIQLFVVSNSTQTKYFANMNERSENGMEQHILKSLAFFWTDKDNQRINRLFNFSEDFFDKFSITEMLTRFMVVKESEPIIMVMRPYQIYAVKEACRRIFDVNMNGFVFHTTGSGKTLTSFKLATILRDDPRVDRVFFLIDRKDLDDQTVDEYNSFEKDCVDNTDNTKQLVDDLASAQKKMIITTIQKMATALKKPQYEKIMEPLQDAKCVFIIDECHRSQFGKMHGDIKRHFHNANYIGFTGTPIFKENKGNNPRTTADVFETKDPDKIPSCLHKYMIKEAIADGNVLRFSVEYLKSVNVLRHPDAGIDSSKLDDPDYCKKHNINLDGLLHDPNRIHSIAEDILNNLPKHTHPEGSDVYTAMFAVDKIQTLMDYYHEMKALNNGRYKIAAIFTYQANEDMDEQDEHSSEYLRECMKDYNEMFGTDYDLDRFDAYRKDISKRLKQKDVPQVDLLLVVNMFLTGFDSKPTNTLILDKNLIYHSLVQAYSRTNRVDKTTKQFGQIITYRNIKRDQDKALALFSGSGNPNDYLLESYEYYTAEYSKQAQALKDICPTPDDAGYLVDEDKQREYVIVFRELTKALSTAKTFSKFDWADLDVFMPEDEYADYKSWYLTFFDEQKKKSKRGETTTLVDVDFSIEFVRTDKINVVYILNLLKEINRNDKKAMTESIDLILRELERSDNEKMRYKKDMMKAFIQLKFYQLDPEDDIVLAYEEYEREVMENDMEQFATEYGIDEKIVADITNEYFSNESSVTKESIRNRIRDLNLGLLKETKLIKDILIFVRDMYDKFTAEGI